MQQQDECHESRHTARVSCRSFTCSLNIHPTPYSIRTAPYLLRCGLDTHGPSSSGLLRVDDDVRVIFYKSILNTLAVSSANLGSMLIFAGGVLHRPLGFTGVLSLNTCDSYGCCQGSSAFFRFELPNLFALFSCSGNHGEKSGTYSSEVPMLPSLCPVSPCFWWE